MPHAIQFQTDVVAVQRVFYNQKYNFICRSLVPQLRASKSHSLVLLADQWMLVMSTQLIGFSVGGILRRFLVQPPSMSRSSNFSAPRLARRT